MNFTNLRYLLFFLIAIFGCSMFSACKYEDNPFISFRTKKARLVNSWQYELVLRNGLDVTTGRVVDSDQEVTIDYSLSSIGFDDQGRFATWIHFVDTLRQYDGDWEFSDDKEEVKLTYDASAVPPTGNSETWKITRLQERHLWLEEQTPEGNNIQYRLVPNISQ